MVAGECQTKNMNEYDPDEQEETPPELDAGDIELLKTYGNGPYTLKIKDCEDEIKKQLPCVSNAMVIGDRRKYLTVFLCLKTKMKILVLSRSIPTVQTLRRLSCPSRAQERWRRSILTLGSRVLAKMLMFSLSSITQGRWVKSRVTFLPISRHLSP